MIFSKAYYEAFEQKRQVKMSERLVEELLQNAENVASHAHSGQVDLGGVPYIEHPRTVASLCHTPEAKVVAWLHDTIEDTDTTREDLLNYGFPEDLVDVVCLLTKTEADNADYLSYIKRIAEHPLAREVKIADITHNMDLSRIPSPTSMDLERIEKYKKALHILQ